MLSAAEQIPFIAFIAWLIPASLFGAPITDFDSVELDSVLSVGHQTLSWEDVQVLLAQNDHGWHLGWFKNKLDGDVHIGVSHVPVGAPGAPMVVAVPSVIERAGRPPVSSSSPSPLPNLLDVTPWGQDTGGIQQAPADPSSTTGASPSIVAPEPASPVLFATGLMLVGRHFRSKYVRREHSPVTRSNCM